MLTLVISCVWHFLLYLGRILILLADELEWSMTGRSVSEWPD